MSQRPIHRLYYIFIYLAKYIFIYQHNKQKIGWSSSIEIDKILLPLCFSSPFPFPVFFFFISNNMRRENPFQAFLYNILNYFGYRPEAYSKHVLW